MIEIQKPNINREDLEAGRKTRYFVEPLERGFGTTLGNSLRRILLGALPGAAPVGIKINGVQHEFTAIPGKHDGSAMPMRSWSLNFSDIYFFRASATARVVPRSSLRFKEKS